MRIISIFIIFVIMISPMHPFLDYPPRQTKKPVPALRRMKSYLVKSKYDATIPIKEKTIVKSWEANSNGIRRTRVLENVRVFIDPGAWWVG